LASEALLPAILSLMPNPAGGVEVGCRAATPIGSSTIHCPDEADGTEEEGRARLGGSRWGEAEARMRRSRIGVGGDRQGGARRERMS
jgi:hypothetical protein